MLTQAIPTLLVWVVVVVALDLESVMSATGVVVALLLGWREERRQLAEPAKAECEGDPFEETPPIFHE